MLDVAPVTKQDLAMIFLSNPICNGGIDEPLHTTSDAFQQFAAKFSLLLTRAVIPILPHGDTGFEVPNRFKLVAPFGSSAIFDLEF